MVCTEGAKIIEAQELKEMMDEQSTNPTIERLIFIEAKAANGTMKVFPCFAAGYSESKQEVPKKDILMFDLYLVQTLGNGTFGLLEVVVKEEELGVSKRLWDKPPTKGLREETPWVSLEKGVQ